MYTDVTANFLRVVLYQVQPLVKNGTWEEHIEFSIGNYNGPKGYLEYPSGELEATIFALRKFTDYLEFVQFTPIMDSTSICMV